MRPRPRMRFFLSQKTIWAFLLFDTTMTLMKKPSLQQAQYYTFVVIGLALLWPWNCFLSASEYFASRFLHTGGTQYAKLYSSTMMSVSTLLQLAFNYFLSQKQVGADYGFRFVAGIAVSCVVFLLIAASCIMFLGLGAGVYFAFLMVMVGASSLSVCSAQNGSMAIVNVFGPIYAQGLMVGQAIAGVLPSVTLIISIFAVGKRPVHVTNVEKDYGVMTYFLTSTLVSLVALVMFLAFVNKKKRHAYAPLHDEPNDIADDPELEVHEDFGEDSLVIEHEHVSFMYLFFKLRNIVVTLVLIFVISLIFPVFASNIESVNKPAIESPTKLHFSDSNIFIPFAFMIWNVGDLAGRVAAGWTFFQMTNETLMVSYGGARLIFLPLLMVCNLSGDVDLAYIRSDFIYLLIQFLYGFTNGHLCSNCFMNVGPKFEKDNEKKAAGGFTTVFLSIGLALGSLCSYLFVAII